MDKAIYDILTILENDGHEAYVVGGSVRDILLGRTVTDQDITTSALPQDVMRLFKDHDMYTTGLKHGTVAVIYDHQAIEITTFRKDGIYYDFRHPSEVYYTKDIREDLKRRDFTINTFIMDKDEKIYDLLNAKDDLDHKMIRTVGDPDERFKEDALRILRAIRFSATLHFKIEEKTKKAIFKNAHELKHISKERIAAEFLKTLAASDLSVLEEYRKVYAGLIDYGNTTRLDKTDDLHLRLALLFVDRPEELDKLYLKKKMIKSIKDIIAYKDASYDELPHVFSKVDVLRYLSFIKIIKDTDIKKAYDELKDYIVRDDLAISSKELMALGYKGKALGTIKKELIRLIWRKELKNKHEDIMTYLKEVL